MADALAGWVAGVSQVLVGHPFDTVKVRIQTGQFATVTSCVCLTWKSEGVVGFYRGVPSPLLGIAACNSVLFSSYHLARQHLDVSMAGCISGLAMGVVNCPVELLKVKLQTGDLHFWDCSKSLWRLGGLRSFFKGISITLLRDAPSFAAYFVVYENGKSSNSLGTVLSGASAGVAAWLACYPQDVIKSVIQSASSPMTISQAARCIYTVHGWRGFWLGIGPTLARAVPANAATFYTFELIKSVLSS